jgi:multiple sugar transport system ATP-binding protein
MNFLPGVVEAGRFRFAESRNAIVGGVSDADFAARPPRTSSSEGPPTIPLNETLADGPAVLGVRPEDLLTARDGLAVGDVAVDTIEHMGHETIAHFTLAGNPHAIRLPANTAIDPGDGVPLSIRPGSYHLFAADDGRRLN